MEVEDVSHAISSLSLSLSLFSISLFSLSPLLPLEIKMVGCTPAFEFESICVVLLAGLGAET